MNKSTSRKALKVNSIIMIIFASLGVISGLLLLIGGGALGASGIDAADDGVTAAGGLTMILGFGMLISSLFNLLIGIFGLRGANNPRKIGVFFVLAIIGVVFAALNVMGTLFGGSADFSTILSSLISFILPVVCVILANNIKKES